MKTEWELYILCCANQVDLKQNVTWRWFDLVGEVVNLAEGVHYEGKGSTCTHKWSTCIHKGFTCIHKWSTCIHKGFTCIHSLSILILHNLRRNW